MNTYFEFKFEGCHEYRDILLAFLQQIDFDGFDESIDGELSAYISVSLFEETKLKETLSRVPESISYSYEELADRNWNQVWESNFKPIVVDDFCLIRADFHAEEFKTEHTITINPKQSFGTGHHETTYMMIRQMRHLDLKEKLIYDIGTGTGILAILAEKLGAQHILATENDPKAITNAIENVEANQCQCINIQDHNYPLQQHEPDVILANINMNVLFDYSTILKAVLKSGGSLLLSGLLESQLAAVIQEYTHDTVLVKRSVEKRGEWCLVLLEKMRTILISEQDL